MSRFSLAGGRLVPIIDAAPADADRRCPLCGNEGVPDSAINARLFFCEGCGNNFFVSLESTR